MPSPGHLSLTVSVAICCWRWKRHQKGATETPRNKLPGAKKKNLRRNRQSHGYYFPPLSIQLTKFTTEMPQAMMGRWREREIVRGDSEKTTDDVLFSPAGTCHVSVCLTPESGDVSTTANTHTHTHTHTYTYTHTHTHTHSAVPSLTSLIGNKQHDETQHYRYCSISWQSAEQLWAIWHKQRKNTHAQIHTLTLLPDHNSHRQTNHYTQRSGETD